MCTMRQFDTKKMSKTTKTFAAIATSVAVTASVTVGAPAASAQQTHLSASSVSSTHHASRNFGSIAAWFKSLFSMFGSSGSSEATVNSNSNGSTERPPEDSTQPSTDANANTQTADIPKINESSSNDVLSQLTANVIKETNAHRKANGLNELSVDSDLQSKAQAYANEMESYNTNNYSDTPINYKHQQGIDHYENIMWAHNMQPSSIDPFESWKNSEGHNRNMLADVQKIGVGLAFDQNTKHFFAVMKLK